MSSIRYRPEIDGLRTLAVIPVILYHMGQTWIPGGYLGVDVFFVISGFLITSIIAHEFDDGTFRFSRFWSRRIRRIVPPLVAMLLATTLAGRYLLFGTEINDLGLSGAAAGLSLANICLWRMSGDYWGTKADNAPLLHTWSLSVEEQFYLLYPLIIVGLLTFARNRAYLVLLAMVGLGYGCYLWGAWHDPTATFYLLPTRAWELACGCALAIHARRQLQHADRELAASKLDLSLVGLLIVAISYLLFAGHGRYPGALFFPLLGTVLMIKDGGREGSLVNRWLTRPWMVYVGKISYSLYLWHWPILCLHRQASVEIRYGIGIALTLPLIALCAILSYHIIEQPLRRMEKAVVPIVLTLLACVAYSGTLYYGDFSYDTSRYSPTVWKGRVYDVSPRQTWSEVTAKRMRGIDAPTRSAEEDRAYVDGGVMRRYGGSTPEVVVLGDSHALMWSGVIDDICRELEVSVSFYAADGVTPNKSLPPRKNIIPATNSFTSEELYEFESAKLEYLKKWKPKLVVVVGNWYQMNRLSPDLYNYVESIGSRMLLIQQPPKLYFGNRNAPQFLSHLKMEPEENTRRYLPTVDKNVQAHADLVVRQIVERYSFCEAAEIASIYQNERGEAWVLDGDDVLYIDDDHLSQRGAEKAEPVIREKMQKLLASPVQMSGR